MFGLRFGGTLPLCPRPPTFRWSIRRQLWCMLVNPTQSYTLTISRIQTSANRFNCVPTSDRDFWHLVKETGRGKKGVVFGGIRFPSVCRENETRHSGGLNVPRFCDFQRLDALQRRLLGEHPLRTFSDAPAEITIRAHREPWPNYVMERQEASATSVDRKMVVFPPGNEKAWWTWRGHHPLC